ncbi:DsbA family protein [Kineosporia succinea]|uniref:Protein-disulfide isomerase n=1 Tax=Kineosporia succinea TaxID=84632 RepID=A0ABT9NV05_9ACTN|nr:thioredoxin domain-containing protein [Kineosporia succinea]MDP9824260.1 protein-disulfide isomerase [Kineosporia succinea]
MASGSSTRDARQAKAAQMRAAAAKAEARRRTLLVSGVVLALVVVVVGVFVVVNTTRRDNATSSAANPANITDNAFVDGESSAPVTITVYEDFQCPYCAQFEAANRTQMAQWVKDGDVKVEYHPIAFLDKASTDEYSTRSLNAFGAVVNSSPDAALDFHNLLFENQPAEGGAGLSDDQLVAYAKEAGADEAAVRTAVDEATYEGWTKRVTEASSKAGVTGTPTIMVDGQTVNLTAADDTATLATAVQNALDAAGK